MKFNLPFRLGLVCLSAILLSSFAVTTYSHAGKGDKPRIAVLEAQLPPAMRSNRESLYLKVPPVILDAFILELRGSDRFQILSNQQVSTNARRNNLVLTSNPDKETAVRIGKILGVNYLLVSEVKN